MTSTTPEISLDQLETALGDGAALIDVREPGEYTEAHIPGARLLPMSQLGNRLAELDRAAPVYVVCAAGGRSAAMTDLLTEAGHDAYSVTGGTSAWIASGRDVATGTEPR